MKEVESEWGERIQKRVTKNTKNTGNVVFVGRLTELSLWKMSLRIEKAERPP